jgi:hypothetical protein
MRTCRAEAESGGEEDEWGGGKREQPMPSSRGGRGVWSQSPEPAPHGDVPLPYGPVHPVFKRLLQVGRGGRQHPLRADADGDVVEEALGELLLHGRHVILAQVGAQQAHAAVDVEADAARRDDRRWVGHVERCDVADCAPAEMGT